MFHHRNPSGPALAAASVPIVSTAVAYPADDGPLNEGGSQNSEKIVR